MVGREGREGGERFGGEVWTVWGQGGEDCEKRV